MSAREGGREGGRDEAAWEPARRDRQRRPSPVLGRLVCLLAGGRSPRGRPPHPPPPPPLPPPPPPPRKAEDVPPLQPRPRHATRPETLSTEGTRSLPPPLRRHYESRSGTGSGEARVEGSPLPRASPGGSPSSPSLLPLPPPPSSSSRRWCVRYNIGCDGMSSASRGREAARAAGGESGEARATAATNRRVDSYVQYIVKKSSSREELVTRRKKKEKKTKKKIYIFSLLIM